jgi:hypothetical protein
MIHHLVVSRAWRCVGHVTSTFVCEGECFLEGMNVVDEHRVCIIWCMIVYKTRVLMSPITL